ncbi:retrovirus-related Pol polyprotein from type-2 retrotransposable element R2DM [Trichonephila clavipes]|nr:retrovirus-related Pol polyprotein from type-2 retrotransposable element R2DM [Trichonephila clavipes]
MKSAENSAPGPDRLTYRHWREVDPYCKVITRIFNICLKMSNIPSAWKTSSTVLIHKKDDPTKLENWRPISLSSTLYKLFTKCLTRKLGDWCEMLEVLSSTQKGFTPHDGVLEHNFLVQEHLHSARKLRKDRYIAWTFQMRLAQSPGKSLLTRLLQLGLTKTSSPSLVTSTRALQPKF